METQMKNLKTSQQLLVSGAQEKRFSDQLNGLIMDGKVKLRNKTLGVKVDITGGSERFKILDSQTKKIPGISDWDGDSLPTNFGMVIEKLAVRYAEGDADEMGSADFSKKLPPALNNAILGIEQNGDEVFRAPVSDLSVSGTPTAPDEQFLELSVPRIMVDEATVDMYFYFPKGSTVAAASGATDKNLAEVKVCGVSTHRSQ